VEVKRLALSVFPRFEDPKTAEPYKQDTVQAYLRDSRLEPLSYDSFAGTKPLYYHTFRQACGDKDTQASFHVMQDLKDVTLDALRMAGSNLYYNRVLLENVFLCLRHMILFERKLTLWEVPPTSDDSKYLQLYSPFFLYRDIWAALLAQYWSTADGVHADHISRTVAIYFAQLLPTHPCQVNAYREDKSKCKKSECKPFMRKECPCLCLCLCRSGNHGHFCGVDNFPQDGCRKLGEKLDSVLVAAFAECVCRNGNISAGLSERTKVLLNAIFDAVLDLPPALVYQLWLFLTDYLLRKSSSACLSDADKLWYRTIGDKVCNAIASDRKAKLVQGEMLETYIAACIAAGACGDAACEAAIGSRGNFAWTSWLFGNLEAALERFGSLDEPVNESLKTLRYFT